MATQTAVKERQIRVSHYGSGREHTHVILSKSRGLDRVMAVSTFDNLTDASSRAHQAKRVYESMGFRASTTWAGTILQLSKAGESNTYLFTRPCTLRHNIDG